MSETGNAAAEIMYHYALHDTHGYTQGDGREGTGTEQIDYKGLTLTIPGGDGDCSNGVVRAWRAVGRLVSRDLTSYASYTGNIKPALLSTGRWEVLPLTRRAEVNPGDLYLSVGHHVAMVIDYDHLAEFWINEFGGIIGGRPGDQTGQECRYREYYNYPWDCIMHYTGPDYLGELLEEIDRKVKQIMSMDCIINPNNCGRLDVLIGGQVHPAYHPDEIEAIQKVHRAINDGAELPVIELGSEDAPWASRLYDLLSRPMDRAGVPSFD